MPSRRSAELPGKSAAMVEVVLSNDRVLRVSGKRAPTATASAV
jgi:hypothetical protein